MKDVVICLKENGDGFTVRNASVQILNPFGTNLRPECIRDAESCTNRKEVENYINRYLISLSRDKDNKYSISNWNGTQTQVELIHDHFYDKDPRFVRHPMMRKGLAHEDTPEQMLQFVRNRSSFFVENYTKGQEYRNTSWLNLSWIVTFMDYWWTTFKNKLADTLIGAFVLGIEPSHFCDDFDLGYKSSKDFNPCNEEAIPLAL